MIRQPRNSLLHQRLRGGRCGRFSDQADVSRAAPGERSGEPFHAGFAWDAMDLGLKVMSKLLAR
jgi:hypothetical protein